ncbi:MAG: MmgE/PrpD family protein [Armatimonadota bacterium]|nr:MmgE/PrpD family protein [Armatimonadota bacterium]MDR7437989.1 MmgE/PrpD family protein [Armatimonadota bacterium]MDR7473071.1 MmgE/PrpD family protein [Armatimonadota bacterium]MDR7507399.1 MmgE/PrpD family protein [Armatimonadota bacterium]MDR7509408.1 MmgE/PrpD family protein [Armatimonadota bacterium]
MTTHRHGRVPATRRLAEWVAGLRWEDLPAQVAGHVRAGLLDTLGCGLFGSTLPWGQIAIRFVRTLGQGSEATLWGDGGRVPAANAALANGTLVHAFEMDDLHTTGVLHPGAVSVTAALAVAERRERAGGPAVDGRTLLTALVAGYEVGARIGLASGYAQLRRGYHPAATTGVFCAAAAASRILGLGADATWDALGIAGTQAAGLMAAQYGSMVKRMHLGRSAQSGVYAADLAAMGFRGVREVLEAPYGGFLTTLIGDDSGLESIVDGLGEQFALLGTGFKIYPSCGSSHTTVDALLAMKARCPELGPETVESVDVQTTTSTRDHVGWPYAPDTVTTAQMNLPYTVAVLLLDGGLSVRSFADERLRDPAVLELSRRVRVVADPELDARGREYRHAARVRVRLRDGRMLEEFRVHARGTPHNPVTWQELTRKFFDLVGEVLSADRARRIHELVKQVELLPAVSPLTDLLVREEVRG